MSEQPARSGDGGIHTFAFADETALQQILAVLGETFEILSAASLRKKITLLDTFDWRLWRRGDVLRYERSARTKVLEWSPGNHRLLAVPVPARPHFADDLPPGRLGSAVVAAISMRRLLPLATADLNETALRLVDRRRKTLVRLRARQGAIRQAQSPHTTPTPVTLTVERLRGYDQPFEAVVATLRSATETEELAEPYSGHLLTAIGIEPGAAVGEEQLQLDPDLRADEAAKAIHRRLLTIIKANEPGVRDDLDSEFLHDFRVAVRRTRSALTQIKRVFPVRTLERFRREFAWLGKVTGPTRDLDVWLLKLPKLQALLTEGKDEDASAFSVLEAHLRRRQEEEHRLLVSALDSGRYQRLIKSWEEFLGQPCPSSRRGQTTRDVENAARPIGQVLGRRLRKIFRRVIADGRAIDQDTPADALHELRITCKKLRYLLEFGRSLVPRDSIEPLVKRLKGLQDVLGDFNDFEVQQSSLGQFAEEMIESEATDDRSPAATLMVLGRLAERLADAQEAQRRAFFGAFGRFDRPATHKRFRRLVTEMVP